MSRRTQDPARLPDHFDYRTCTFFGRAFNRVRLCSFLSSRGPSTPVLRPVWASPLSLAATQGITVVFFSSGYLDVSVHRVPGVWLWIHHTSPEGCSGRFPHSDISGSKDICSSPKLFAAYHVFHRLLVPRHPPCALHSLTKTTSTCGCGFPSRPIALGPLVLGSYFNAFASTSLFLSIQSLVWPRMSCLSYLS